MKIGPLLRLRSLIGRGVVIKACALIGAISMVNGSTLHEQWSVSFRWNCIGGYAYAQTRALEYVLITPMLLVAATILAVVLRR